VIQGRFRFPGWRKLGEVWRMSNWRQTGPPTAPAGVSGCRRPAPCWRAPAGRRNRNPSRMPCRLSRRRRAASDPAAFRFKPGFRLGVGGGAGAEPYGDPRSKWLLDKNGRLFVVERPELPARSGTNVLGRVRFLEDTGGRRASTERRKVYADNLPQASAIACYGGRGLRCGQLEPALPQGQQD